MQAERKEGRKKRMENGGKERRNEGGEKGKKVGQNRRRWLEIVIMLEDGGRSLEGAVVGRIEE